MAFILSAPQCYLSFCSMGASQACPQSLVAVAPHSIPLVATPTWGGSLHVNAGDVLARPAWSDNFQGLSPPGGTLANKVTTLARAWREPGASLRLALGLQGQGAQRHRDPGWLLFRLWEGGLCPRAQPPEPAGPPWHSSFGVWHTPSSGLWGPLSHSPFPAAGTAFSSGEAWP